MNSNRNNSSPLDLTSIFQTFQKINNNIRTSNDALTPKNTFAPLITIQVNDETNGITTNISTQQP